MLSRCCQGGARRLRAALAPAGAAKTPLSLGAAGGPSCTSVSGTQLTYCSGAARWSAETAGQQQELQQPSSKMHSASGSTADHHLPRLAKLWGMPAELLFERQQVVAKLLAPAGCGTPAHALWLLVRSPQLRHASETSLRHSLRQLQRLVSHADIDREAVLTAVYKQPWVVEAVADDPAPGAAAAAGQPQQQQQQQLRASAEPASWWRELAAVVLELQQADWAEHVSSGGSSSRGIRMSPGFAAAAVRIYLAVGEVGHAVSNATSSTANRLLGIVPQQQDSMSSPPAAVADASPQQQPAAHSLASQGSQAGAAASNSTSSSHGDDGLLADDPFCTGGGTSEVLQRLQQQQQQHLLLQQLLAACPHLVVLPPELLLARWHALLSVVQGGADDAWQLVLGNPYLLCDYNDVAELRADAQALRRAYA